MMSMDSASSGPPAVPEPDPNEARPNEAGPNEAGSRPGRSLPKPVQIGAVAGLCCLAGVGVLVTNARSAPPRDKPAAQGRSDNLFVPTAAQMASFTVQPVEEKLFQPDQRTEGKISVDEDRTTQVFSPYAGRVIRLIARQGDVVSRGEVLFTVEATDMVQAQNDLLAANGTLNKARSQLQLAQTIEKRQRELNDAKAIALKELQSAQNELVSAQNDLRGAEGALEAVRNRLAILGKSEADIAAFLEKGRISPETPIQSPIAGTVIGRKVGPGQYVSGSSGDPAYTIGDLSAVWLVAQVREADAPSIKLGQTVRFRVLAFPDRVFEARVTFVASAIDPATRRVQVRAQVANPDGLLKPEMFASVRIILDEGRVSPAVPREAIIYEGETARVWVVTPEGALELRRVTAGVVSGGLLQVTSGLRTGETIVTKGSLFIDRLANGQDS